MAKRDKIRQDKGGQMLQNKEKVKNKIIKISFIVASILFAIPSIMYIIKNKTVLEFGPYFQFLYDAQVTRLTQTLLYIIILTLLTIIYFLIIKNKKKIFENTKKMFIFIALISIIFIAVLPFTCSDVFYYLGIGRLDSKYGKNPYYTTMKEFVENDNNSTYLNQDTVLQQGYINDWSDQSVVYGPVWTLVCKVVGAVSFGNIDLGLFFFKLINLITHLLNCYLIYKISNKKVFTIIYGLNPFILIEGIACVHNDIFVVLFILISLYFLIKKKNLGISVASLAMATAIKYFAILLLPFIIIYHFRKETPLKRLEKCFQYGFIFLIILAIPYLFYVRDGQVLNGIFVQQQKLAKSFYIIITEYFRNPDISVVTVNKVLLYAFIIIYFFTCIILLNKKNIKLRTELKTANYFIMAFLFLLITNFQPWYIMWLFPLIMWQKADDIKLIIKISLISQFANSIFLTYGEGWQNGTPFVLFMVIGTLVAVLYDTRMKKGAK